MALFADVTFSTEGIVIIGGLLSALVGALIFIFKLLMQVQKEKFELALSQKEDSRKSYKEIAEEAVAAAEKRIGSKVPPLAAVVSEHHSPPTEEQKAAAELQTLRARVTAVTHAAGLPPRTSGEPGEETEPAAETPAPTPSELAKLQQTLDEVPDKTAEKVVEKVVDKVAEKVVEKIRKEKEGMTP